MPPYPKTPTGGNFNAQMPPGQPQVGMALEPFEALIRSHGIRMIHSKPVPCPYRSDLYSEDHDPACSECHNGYIYYGFKEFIGAFMGNSINKQFGLAGTWDVDQAQIIIPTQYIDGSPMDVQYYDQILMPDATVRYTQLVEHSQTGIDRLHFEARAIDFVKDSSGQEYVPGVDVSISPDGKLQWLSQNRPAYDLTIDRGAIYSVNYYCAPLFTVISLPHQLRVMQTMGGQGGSVQQRFPQLAIVRKEFLPKSEADKSGPSDAPEPRDGSA